MAGGRRIAGVLLLALLLVGAGGCWDQIPVEWRAVVTAIGVDPTRDPGIERYTFIFPNISLTTSTLPTTPTSQEFYSIVVRAPSLMMALRALQARQSRILYLGQLRILALSTRLPQSVWRRILSAAADSGRFVLTFWAVATPAAGDLVRLISPTQIAPEVALYRALNSLCQPIIWPGRGWKLWVDTVTPGISPAVADVVPVGSDSFHLGPLYVLSGNPRLWSPGATRGWAYLTGQVRWESMRVHIAQGRFTLSFIRGAANLSFQPRGSSVLVDDHLSYAGTITTNAPMAHSEAMNDALERAAAGKIRQAADAAWRMALATGTDPMGWHRDVRWMDSRVPIGQGKSLWSGWSLSLHVHFKVRDEGALE